MIQPWHHQVSLAGALFILAAYTLLQFNRLEAKSKVFLVMNTLGGALLTWVAISQKQAGFIVLEGSWTLLSFYGLLREFIRKSY